ncbi:MAG: 16S rRNA (guanine(527)-N(7))-methyltransferase RsmG [Ruminococcaceae bacterium]|nr:16S rRNA (guanine(527)-N(7))-methyltransferase RsmG [Oscillospiraceae bacterium]
MNLKELFSLMGLTIDDTKEEQFKKYTKLLTDYNNKVNLTSILDPDEINLKHYLDSVLPVLSGFFKDGMSVIDVGCGAGFPSVPLKIYNPSLKFTLLDSLNKRINFLNILIEELGLTDISTFHSRAEDAGHMENYRQKYDICVARAVAPLNVLMEYCTPFVKCDGYFIALKGKDGDIELDNAKNAMKILNIELVKKEEFILPGTDNQRKIYIFKKIKSTPDKYPRQAGKPTKNPL